MLPPLRLGFGKVFGKPVRMSNVNGPSAGCVDLEQKDAPVDGVAREARVGKTRWSGWRRRAKDATAAVCLLKKNCSHKYSWQGFNVSCYLYDDR